MPVDIAPRGTLARKNWWERHTRNKPFHCYTSTDVCPDLVPEEEFGHHVSVVSTPGVRLWAFVTEEAKDKFQTDVAEGAFRRRNHATQID